MNKIDDALDNFSETELNVLVEKLTGKLMNANEFTHFLTGTLGVNQAIAAETI